MRLKGTDFLRDRSNLSWPDRAKKEEVARIKLFKISVLFLAITRIVKTAQMFLTIGEKSSKIDKNCQDDMYQDVDKLMKLATTFGETIRAWRKQRGEPLRVVAAAVEIDSTLLSKIERGERLPTETQLARFAAYFEASPNELAAQVIADKIVAEYGHQEGATLQALNLVRERIAPYRTEKLK